MFLKSKIYLKGERDPLICSERSALGVQQIFMDAYAPMSKQITVGRHTFTKDAIRRIYVEKDQDKNSEPVHVYWVIYDPFKNRIWKGIFKTEEAAQAELDMQELQLNGKPHPWRVEKRITSFKHE